MDSQASTVPGADEQVQELIASMRKELAEKENKKDVEVGGTQPTVLESSLSAETLVLGEGLDNTPKYKVRSPDGEDNTKPDGEEEKQPPPVAQKPTPKSATAKAKAKVKSKSKRQHGGKHVPKPKQTPRPAAPKKTPVVEKPSGVQGVSTPKENTQGETEPEKERKKEVAKEKEVVKEGEVAKDEVQKEKEKKESGTQKDTKETKKRKVEEQQCVPKDDGQLSMRGGSDDSLSVSAVLNRHASNLESLTDLDLDPSLLDELLPAEPEAPLGSEADPRPTKGKPRDLKQHARRMRFYRSLASLCLRVTKHVCKAWYRHSLSCEMLMDRSIEWLNMLYVGLPYCYINYFKKYELISTVVVVLEMFPGAHCWNTEFADHVSLFFFFHESNNLKLHTMRQQLTAWSEIPCLPSSCWFSFLAGTCEIVRSMIESTLPCVGACACMHARMFFSCCFGTKCNVLVVFFPNSFSKIVCIAQWIYQTDSRRFFLVWWYDIELCMLF